MAAKGFFVTGTDTGVGKTAVTALLLRALQQRGLHVGVMKPVETGVDPECHSAANSDARFLMDTGNLDLAPEDVCLFRFKTPASPWQAAKMENRTPVTLAPIVNTFNRLATQHDWMLVEGIGGLQVPLNAVECVGDLARSLELPLIIATRYSLGTQNHTLLTVNAARSLGLRVSALMFCPASPESLTPVEQTQPQLLGERCGVAQVGELPFLPELNESRPLPSGLISFGPRFNIDALLSP